MNRYDAQEVPESSSARWPSWAFVVAEAARGRIHVHELLEAAKREGYGATKSVNLVAFLEDHKLVVVRGMFALITMRGRRFLDAHCLTAPCLCFVCRRLILDRRAQMPRPYRPVQAKTPRIRAHATRRTA